MTIDEAPPPKRTIPIGQALVMISLISVCWTASACLGSWIAFNGLAAQTPRLVNGMMAEIIGSTVDDYMTYMYYRDAGAAWFLFADESVTVDDLQAQLDDHYELFDGYVRLDVTEAEGLPDDIANDNQTIAESMAGRDVTLRGNIEYEGGFTGTFVAVLTYDEEGEYWAIQSIEITVPPEKIEAMND